MELFSDPRWDAYGMLRESYLAVTARIDAEVSPDGAFDASLSDLLFRLARSPDAQLRSVDITRSLATSTTRTTRLLDEAEQRGWISRSPHPTDRRATTAALTEAGHDEAVKRGKRALTATQRWIHDTLTPDEIGSMINILRKLRDANH